MTSQTPSQDKAGPSLPGRNSRRWATKRLEEALRAHQIELEMQNGELQRAQSELALVRDRFVDLYDFAPVGYFTLDPDGRTFEANLTGAALLGAERSTVTGQPLSRFIDPQDADRWHRHLQQSWRVGGSSRIELLVHPRRGADFHAQLDCLLAGAQGSRPAALRVTLTDVSLRRQAEMFRRVAISAMARREAECRTLALALHEDLGQRLSALKMDLAALQASEGQPERAQRMGTMQAVVGSAVSALRRISTDLRPLMLDDLGLQAAADWLVRDVSARAGVVVALKFQDIEPPLEDTAAVAVYRMLQDLLDCLVNGRQAQVIDVSLSRQAPGLRLDVLARDMASGESAHSAMAITTLREHAQLSGWEFRLAAQADGSLHLSAGLALCRDPTGGRLRLVQTTA